MRIEIDGIVGECLYLYTYPKAILTDYSRSLTFAPVDARVIERFERRPQRVGILTDSGESWHFTVPRKVIYHDKR